MTNAAVPATNQIELFRKARLRVLVGFLGLAESCSSHAEEIWESYVKGEIRPDLKLTGKFEFPTEAADVDAVLHLIDVA